MDRLEKNLYMIKEQKDTYIKPENIKAGITIFGVTGTYTGETASISEEEG